MTSLQYLRHELIIASNNKAIFVNPKDLQIFKEVIIPEDLRKAGLLVENNANTKDSSTQNALQKPCIQHAKLSPNGLHFAITTYGQKSVLLYDCQEEFANLISVRSLARASSALAFSFDSKLLLITDKTGDCYLYDCGSPKKPPKLIFGHLSIVYDVTFTLDHRFIITCDRDDKIRVTNYPNFYEIHGYCLGHKEFVSSIQLLGESSPELLLSISGDNMLRLWNYITGEQLSECELPAAGLHFTVRQLDASTWNLGVLVYHPTDSVCVFNLKRDSNGLFKFNQVLNYSFPTSTITNLCFVEDHLYACGIKNGRFTILVINGEAPDNWIKMVEEQFKDCTVKPEDVSEWFKKKFDNVTDYLERKKKRIEEKHQK